MSSAQQQVQSLGNDLAARLTQLKVEQDAKEHINGHQSSRKKQASSPEKQEVLSPCSEAVESGDVTPGHEGVKRKDRLTRHQPPGGLLEPKKQVLRAEEEKISEWQLRGGGALPAL